MTKRQKTVFVPRKSVEPEAARLNQTDNNSETALAGFIVGALIGANIIPYDVRNEDAGDELDKAIRIVISCLRTMVDIDDYPDLPFDW